MKTTEQLAAELKEIQEMRRQVAELLDPPAEPETEAEPETYVPFGEKFAITRKPSAPAKLAGSTMWDRCKNYDPNLFY